MAGARSSQGDLCFACVPDHQDDATEERVAAIGRVLADAIGQRVKTRLARTPEELAELFGQGEANVGWVSPTLLLTAAGLAQAVPLVSCVRQGLSAYHAILYVAEHSSISSATGLQGARAAWVAPSSAAGYIFPRLTLASYGMDPRYIFEEEAFLGSHGAVAKAVLSGNADVGGGYAVFEEGNPTRRLLRAPFMTSSMSRGARVLLVTSPIPSDLIVASGDLPSATCESVCRALIRIAGKPDTLAPFTQVLGVDEFRTFDPGLLKPLREQIACGVELGLMESA